MRETQRPMCSRSSLAMGAGQTCLSGLMRDELAAAMVLFGSINHTVGTAPCAYIDTVPYLVKYTWTHSFP